MIEKMKYTVSMYNIEKMAIGKREVFEIYPDGRVIHRLYEAGNRKSTGKEMSTQATSSDFRVLSEKIENCISSANRNNLYINDTSAELKLYCSFDRVESLPGGYGNAKVDVGSIISEYLFDIAHMSY